MKPILDAFRGLAGAAWLHGLLRGIAEAAAFAVVWTVADFIASGGAPDAVGQYGPVLLLLLRTLEGAIDNIDPAKQRARE